jgi:hypothetical protein
MYCNYARKKHYISNPLIEITSKITREQAIKYIKKIEAANEIELTINDTTEGKYGILFKESEIKYHWIYFRPAAPKG